MSRHNKTCRVCRNRKPAKKNFKSKDGSRPRSMCKLTGNETTRDTPKCYRFKERGKPVLKRLRETLFREGVGGRPCGT